MKVWEHLSNWFKRKPRSATEFVNKFIKDSQKERVQFEIIRDNEIIIQVDSLKFTPSWFKVIDVDSSRYEDGYVIFFVLDQKDLDKNEKYIRYKKSGLDLIELDEILDNTPIRTFAKFIEKTLDPVALGKEIKQILDVIIVFKEKDPQAIFNLRYIDNF